MDLVALRSQLACSFDELRNLTFSDLKECNWKTQKQVFSALIMCSKRLGTFAESLQDLNEKRARTINMLRTQNESRDLRKQCEEDYRHHFFELVISVLTELQFPPTLEAFANPLQNLREEIGFKHNAMLYILRNTTDQSPDLHDRRGSRNASDTSEITCRRGSAHASPRTDPDTSSIASCATEKGRPSTPRSRTHTPRTSRPNNDDKLGNTRNPPRSPAPGTANASPPQSSRQNCQDRSLSVSSLHTQDARTLGDYEHLRQTLEVMQHHNEQLSRRLKLMQDAVVARDAAEQRMDLLMRDFKAAVEDVASIGNTLSASVGDMDMTGWVPLDAGRETAAQSTPPPPPSNQRKPAQRGTRGDVSSADRSNVSSSGVVSSSSCRGLRQSGGWGEMKLRLDDIVGRWTTARRDAKAVVTACVAVHPSCSAYMRKTQNTGGGVGQSMKKSFRVDTDTSFGGHTSSALGSSRSNGDASNERPIVEYVQLRTLWSGTASAHCVMDQARGHEGGPLVTPTSDIDGNCGVALHLAKVHALQRDLAHFSVKAFELTHSLQHQRHTDGLSSANDGVVPEDLLVTSSDTHSKPFAEVSADLQMVRALADLRASARQLLLHCSSWAPLAPLTNKSETHSGLEQFVKETCDVLTNRKLMSHSIQRAADRALSEQRSLLISHKKLEAELKQWVEAATECIPLLRAVITRINDHLRRTVGEIDTVTKKVSYTYEAFMDSEKSRVDLGGGALVCPLDALSRGYMGSEVALFVDTYRMNANGMQTLCSSLQSMRKQFVDVITVDFVGALASCIELFSKLQSGKSLG